MSAFWVSKDDQCGIPASAPSGLSMLLHEVCELEPAEHWTGQTHNTENWPRFQCKGHRGSELLSTLADF